MVSWRCTTRMTREPRARSILAISRWRLALSSFWRISGWSAEKMKNTQKRSPAVIAPL